MKIITREEALARGLRRYFTGDPCLNGHFSERYTSGKECIQCNQQKLRMRKDGTWRPRVSKPFVVAPLAPEPKLGPPRKYYIASSLIAPPTRAQLMGRR